MRDVRLLFVCHSDIPIPYNESYSQDSPSNPYLHCGLCHVVQHVAIDDHNTIAASLLDCLLNSPIDLRAGLISTVVVSGEGQAVAPLLEESIRQTCLRNPKYERLRAVIDQLRILQSGKESTWKGYYVYQLAGIRRIMCPESVWANGRVWLCLFRANHWWDGVEMGLKNHTTAKKQGMSLWEPSSGPPPSSYHLDSSFQSRTGRLP